MHSPLFAPFPPVLDGAFYWGVVPSITNSVYPTALDLDWPTFALKTLTPPRRRRVARRPSERIPISLDLRQQPFLRFDQVGTHTRSKNVRLVLLRPHVKSALHAEPPRT